MVGTPPAAASPSVPLTEYPLELRQGRSLSRPNRYRPVHPDHNGAHYRVYVEVVTVVGHQAAAVSRQLQIALKQMAAA